MGFDEQYERWKRTRAKVDMPADFADRVMRSLSLTPEPVRLARLQRTAVALGKSPLVQTAATALALAVCLLRIGSVLAIFIPR